MPPLHRLLLIAICGALPPALATGAPRKLSLETLPPSVPVAERVAVIGRSLGERYFDSAGLMLSHLNCREERPFTPADFTAADPVMPGPAPWQWMRDENSAFVSGLLLPRPGIPRSRRPRPRRPRLPLPRRKLSPHRATQPRQRGTRTTLRLHRPGPGPCQ